MKIVFIGPFGLQPKGTMSARALPLARALVDRGHAVTVLIPPWDDPGRAGQVWQDGGVQVVNTPLPGGMLSRRPPLFHMLLTRTLVTRALAIAPDVVHCFKPKAYAGLSHLALWQLRRRKGLSLRLVVDADDWEQAWNEVLPYSALQKKFFAWQERWGLGQADTITVASRALEELAISQAGVERGRIFYVPNGYYAEVNSGFPDPPPGLDNGQAGPEWEEGPTILLYSRLVEFRLNRIVSLVRLVAAQLPRARWLIVGRGLQGQEKTLAAKLAQAGLDQYVHFAGWPVHQLAAYFKAADVAVHPYDDTLLNRTKCSVKLIELLAAGVPVVADAVGQNSEYIQHNRSGLLIPAEDDVAFSQALVTLLQSPKTQRRLGQAAARYIQYNFAWPRLAEIVERAYY